MNISDRLLFGQYLVERKKITKSILTKALEIQESEKMNESPRMLGSILLNDFAAFTDRMELKRYLLDFEKYQERMREIYLDAKKYGADPNKKLEEEYADLLEELETTETKNVRNVIRKIEKFKIDIKKSRSIMELNDVNEARIESLKTNIAFLNDEIDKLKDGYTKQIEKYNNLLGDYNKLKNYLIKYKKEYGVIE